MSNEVDGGPQILDDKVFICPSCSNAGLVEDWEDTETRERTRSCSCLFPGCGWHWSGAPSVSPLPDWAGRPLTDEERAFVANMKLDDVGWPRSAAATDAKGPSGEKP